MAYDAPYDSLPRPGPGRYSSQPTSPTVVVMPHDAYDSDRSRPGSLREAVSPVERDMPHDDAYELNRSESVPQIRQAPRRYILSGATSFFKVEKEVHKVHRYFLECESEFFRDMFSVPAAPNAEEEGDTEGRAIVIPDVTSEEFLALLDFFYQGLLDEGFYKTSTKDQESRYINLLSISSRFLMANVKNFAIAKLDLITVDPIVKLMLAQKHSITQWLMPTYIELTKRYTALTVDEAEKIGIVLALQLMQAREALHRENCNTVGGQQYGAVRYHNFSDDTARRYVQQFVMIKTARILHRDY